MGTLLASPSTISSFLLAKEFDTAVQLLVLAKLLQDNVSTESNPIALKKVTRQLGALDSLVEKELKAQLSSIDAHQTEVGRLLISLSLLRNLSAKELLNMFLSIRTEKIASILSREESSLESLLQALKLINKTVADGEYIFPKRIGDSLTVLKGRPVIASELLRSAHSLQLDSLESALPSTIRNFRPSMSHDDIRQSEVDKLLSSWIVSELGKFQQVLLEKIDKVTNLRDLLIFRKELLRVWSNNRTKFAVAGPVAADPPRIKYREGLNKRAAAILRTQAEKLIELGEFLKNADKASKNYTTASTAGLWAPSLVNMDIHSGARNFKNEILNQLQGRSPDIKEFQDIFDKWTNAVLEALDSVKHMQKLQSSVDLEISHLDEYGELGDEEADEEAEDMKELEEASKTSVTESFKILENLLAIIAADIIEASKTSSKGILQRAAFLLRAIRISRGYNSEGVDISSWFCKSVHHSLNKVVVEQISVGPLATYRAALKRRSWSQKPEFDSLREGKPPLPAQPTPITFSFLRKLLVSMTELGDDVWGKDAVKALVSVTTGVLSGIYKSELEANSKAIEEAPKTGPAEGGENEAAGEESKPPGPSIAQEWHNHVLFDAMLLDRAFSQPSPDGTLVSSVKSAFKVGLQMGCHRTRVNTLKIFDADTAPLQASVDAYWKRTSLLFSLTG